MTILGIDTSLRSTGYGVVETAGSRLVAREWGRIRNAPTLPLDECIANIYRKVTELAEAWKPDVVSVEKVIYGKNANTMLVLGEARGAVIAAAAMAGVPLVEYEPRRAKAAVCGRGMAEKAQVQRMVKILLNLDEIPQNDAADALALAICHANALPVRIGATIIARGRG